ncbi:carboxypeptidase-like regulatory domain-containing protein [Catellatospora sp. KI3]|uniref:carboxypeptidase-like regulatory domain-containing protein n=1 Tax=Catellatospora sp. KI3 TaxID=3041620 RepID=UPI002482531D|nr:carboxypeptidase-like regulatory domain-containing protein [Catellatospora sp. KI3]MDI1462155.1 carboxypeptidase-like regulatory domain-containing protein [Catellatospora sp. KI3]
MRSLSAATAVALVLFGLGTPAQASADGLDGTVKDALTGAPVVGAGVRIEWADYSHWNFTNSDATGYFSFANQAPGEYIVHVSANGYVEQYLHGHADRYSADPIAVPGSVQVQLMPIQYGDVVGHVRSAAGAALKDVYVELNRDGNWVGSTSTDRTGAYRFEHVETDEDYTLKVRYVNGQEVWYENTTDPYSATHFAVANGATTTIDLTQGPVGNLTIKAVEAGTGAPLAGICFYHQDGPLAFYTVCSGADGKARLKDIPVGTYEGGSFDQAETYLNGHFGPATVTAGQGTTTTVRLRKGGNVHVSFVDAATGEPVSACPSLVEPKNHTAGGGSNCGSTVHFTNYFPQKFQLFSWVFDGAHGAQWLGTDGHGTGTQSQAKVYDLTYGSDISITVPLDAAGSITGTVTDAATGQGLGNVCPSPVGPWASYGPNGPVDCTYGGQYYINNLGPYAWKLVFPVFNGLNGWAWSGNAANRAAATPVQVVAGQTVTVDVALPATGKITGTVLAPSRPNCPQCTTIYVVDAATGDYAGVIPYVKADGTFTITGLNTQNVWIYYSSPDDGLIKHPTKIHVTAGQTVSGVNLG